MEHRHGRAAIPRRAHARRGEGYRLGRHGPCAYMAALFRSLVVIFPPASVWTACESAAAPTPAPTRGPTPADDPPASPVDDPTRLPSPSRLPRGGPKRPLLRAGGLRAAFAARAQVRAQGCGAAAALRSGRIVRRAECGYRAPSRAQNKGRLEESRASAFFVWLPLRPLPCTRHYMRPFYLHPGDAPGRDRAQQRRRGPAEDWGRE